MALSKKSKDVSKNVKFHILVSFLLFLMLGFLTTQMDRFNIRLGRAQSIDDTPVTKNVFLLIFNPIIESRNNQKLTQVKSWHDPDLLTNQILPAINQSSHGYLTYSVVERVEVDGIFVKPDGYQYTDASYLDCVEGRGPCHQPDLIDYQQLFTDYGVCSKNVDEVWMWGGPYFGYLEFNPVSYCGDKTQFVMGFNYERAIGEALHNFGHRMEYVGINRVGDGTWTQNEAHEWNKFSLIAGHCGNIHYPPGSTVGPDEYNYSKTTNVQTDCNGYLHYPNGPFAQEAINCTAWNCTQEGYVKWWLTRIPSNTGTTIVNGKSLYNNWWKYYAFFDETKGIAPSPVPGTFSNLNSSMPKPGTASFTFDYSGIASNYIVDVSTTSDMSFDVYLSFAQGNGSPIVESNPGKWDKYSCGRILYWRVKTNTGIQSPIASQVVDCNTQSPTVTPTPTTLPTNTPTKTPIVTLIPTINLTPTLVPTENNIPPSITTTFMKFGRVRKPYFALVNGQDANSQDTLDLVLTNLPSGLYQNNCNQSILNNRANIECIVVGEPNRRGLYYVKATITDSAGATRTKTLPLLIW